MNINATIAIAIVPKGAGSGSIWITQMISPSTKQSTSNHTKSVITCPPPFGCYAAFDVGAVGAKTGRSAPLMPSMRAFASLPSSPRFSSSRSAAALICA